MNTAFTREELQAYIDDGIDSPTAYSCGTVRELCRALLAEMDKQKDDVWKDAPKWADKAIVTYERTDKANLQYYGRTYTRELPKSRAREIAEVEARIWRDSMPSGADPIADMIESAILKREKELEEGK